MDDRDPGSLPEFARKGRLPRPARPDYRNALHADASCHERANTATIQV
ncbi:MAG: hypothetical protein M3154_08445 [Candidatus Eremiobacteraeota bacterium]|nr:hypothetical protein [Candidatus Eremiobacteraeota bacterium]